MGRSKDVLTTGDVARLCRVTIRTVIKWFENGRLEGYRLPGSRDRRFTRDAVTRFLHENGMPDLLLEGAPWEPRKRRVLVVDDDEPVRTLIQRVLETETQLLVDTAASGWEAGLKTATQKPDLLLLDFRLGDTTGDTVVTTIRKMTDLTQPAIVLMSAHLDEEGVNRVLALGADAFLPKPFAPQALREIVHRHLEARA